MTPRYNGATGPESACRSIHRGRVKITAVRGAQTVNIFNNIEVPLLHTGLATVNLL